MRRILIIGLVLIAALICVIILRHDSKGEFIDALQIGDADTVAQLIDQNPDLINARLWDNGATALHVVAGNGQWDIVKLLLDRGAEVDAKNASGYTPLLSAVRSHYYKSAKILAEYGADIYAKDEYGSSVFDDIERGFIPESGILKAHEDAIRKRAVSDNDSNRDTAPASVDKAFERINPQDGAEMIWIPAGEFLMGASEAEVQAIIDENRGFKAEWYADEMPQRKVYLDGYWIYKNEVTVAQYRRFCNATGRAMPPDLDWTGKDNHPIRNISLQNALEYSEWAGATLPSEAQWEKAARGTDGRRYPWGNDWDANECASSDKFYGHMKTASLSDKMPDTMPIGSYPAGASPYGCRDMAGNVLEWCADWYDKSYYTTGPSRNPTGPAKMPLYDSGNRIWSGAAVLRGGSFDDSKEDCRCAYREPKALDAHPNHGCAGVRCVILASE
jgi:formylglycine-generating enzyme required for sulfatase activity